MAFIRRFIADEWPTKLWFSVAVAGGFWFSFTATRPDQQDLVSWRFLLLLIPFLVAAIVVALGAALVAGWLLLYPIYAYQAHANGAPFKPNDWVCIICRRGRGRVAQVYSSWQGSSVRVDLGESERIQYRDIFGGHQIRRVAPPANSTPPN